MEVKAVFTCCYLFQHLCSTKTERGERLIRPSQALQWPVWPSRAAEIRCKFEHLFEHLTANLSGLQQVQLGRPKLGGKSTTMPTSPVKVNLILYALSTD